MLMKFIYPEIPLDDRRERLNKESVKKEQRDYFRTLPSEEVQSEKSKYVEDALAFQIEDEKLENLKAEHKNIQAEAKAKLENLHVRMNERLEKIKTARTSQHGVLYGMADYTNKKLNFYDCHGEFIDSRDMLPKELQGNIFVPQDTKDLPKETQGVVNDILSGKPKDKVKGKKLDNNAHIETLEILNEGKQDAVVKNEHTEEAWALMTDDDLTVVYGTTDIAVIRTMVYNEKLTKWQTPADFEKSKKKGETPTALQSVVPTDEDSEKKRQEALAANAEKNKGKSVKFPAGKKNS